MAKPNRFEEQVKLQQVEPRGRRAKIHNENSQTPSRRGKVGVTLYFDVDTHRTLKQLVVDGQVDSITAMLIEGTNLALQKYGKKPIA